MSLPNNDPNDPVDAREQQVLDEIADQTDSPLSIELSARGGVPVLRLSGELDVATAGAFHSRLTKAIEESPQGVVIDLSFLSFLDSKGLAVFLRASNQAPGRVAVVSPKERITRLFQATGLAERLRLHRTLPEAVDALTSATP